MKTNKKELFLLALVLVIVVAGLSNTVNFILYNINILVVLAIAALAIYYFMIYYKEADEKERPARNKELSKRHYSKVRKENWQKEAYAGRLSRAPMLDFEGITLYFPSYEREGTTHSSETGVYNVSSTLGTITPQKVAWTDDHRELKFLWSNNNNYPTDILLRFDAFEEVIRKQDGTFLKVYKDVPEAKSYGLPAGELGAVSLDFGITTLDSYRDTTRVGNERRRERPITLVSVFVKPHNLPLSEWKEHIVNVKVTCL